MRGGKVQTAKPANRTGLPFAGLPGLAGGVAGVALFLALGRLGRFADHLLDGLALLARLALDLLDGFLLGAGAGLDLLARLALGLAGFPGLGDLQSFLLAPEDLGIVLVRPGAEPLECRLPCRRRLAQAVLERLLFEASPACPSASPKLTCVPAGPCEWPTEPAACPSRASL
jgi:hypothetical protein